jgi:glycosyltransferase EpsF
MRILHLITSLERGGAEIWLLSMLREVPRETCAMDFCCKGAHVGTLAGDAERLGARVLLNPLTPSHVGFAECLTEILTAGRYDLVHNHLNAYAGFPVWVSNRLGIPVLTTFHATHFAANDSRLRLPVLRQLRWIYSVVSVQYAIAKSTLVSGVSQAVLDSHVPRHSPWRNKCRVLYLGTGVPTLPSESERIALRERIGLPGTAPLVLHVGNFVPVKNHRGVIEVFAEVLATVPEARLILAGAGPLRPEIERLVSLRGLAPAVKFLGSWDGVPSLMTLCDVFLFPSMSEGFPVAALEAGAAGLPIVGSCISGLTEATQDGKSALLHPVGDTAGMARSIVRILGDRALAQQLGRAGRARIERSFSTRAAAERLLSLYGECLNAAGQG